jgi:uncharacterized membrane protein
MTGLLVGLVIAAVVLALALGVGIIVLIKMGVIAQYALKTEPQEEGDFELEQSHDVGKE